MQGRVLGRYELIERLGRGGMGEVWRARDPALRRDVAVKVLRREGDEQATLHDEFIQRFLREARIAASLKHPNIVAIFDVGVDTEPYIVMEYLEGASLRGFLGKNDVPIALRLAWLVEIAQALAAAHDVGLVHRDIKPDNVMITKDGHAKVLDFGIAKAIDQEEKPPSSEKGAPESFRTQHGRVVGTPKYMAPEQMAGDAVDARADQWAWACVAYELLTGTMPDRDETPIPISNTAPEVPFDVAAAIVRARARDPDQRFSTMRTLLDAVSVTSGTERVPILSAPPATTNRPDAPTTTGGSQRSGKSRTPRAIAVALGSFAIAAMIVFAFQRRERAIVPSAQPALSACKFDVRLPFALDGQRAHMHVLPITSGLVASRMVIDDEGKRVEELVTITPETVSMRKPPPPDLPSIKDDTPTQTFFFATPHGIVHYVLYDQPYGDLIVGRDGNNDSLTDALRLVRTEGDTFSPSHTLAMSVPTKDGTTVGFVRTGMQRIDGHFIATIRIDIAGLHDATIFRSNAKSEPSALSLARNGARIAYTFVLESKVYVGAFSVAQVMKHADIAGWPVDSTETTLVDVLEPRYLGETGAEVPVVFEGERVHVAWSERDHPRLHYARLESTAVDAAVVDVPLDVPSDGSSPALVVRDGVLGLAWRDSVHVWYGEGATIEAAARRARSLAESAATSGPWLSGLPHAALVAWIGGAQSEVRRAVVTCE